LRTHKYDVDDLCGESARELHQCNNELRDSAVPSTSPVNGELHDSYSLIYFTLDLQVKNDGAHQACDNDLEGVKLDLATNTALFLTQFDVWVRIFLELLTEWSLIVIEVEKSEHSQSHLNDEDKSTAHEVSRDFSLTHFSLSEDTMVNAQNLLLIIDVHIGQKCDRIEVWSKLSHIIFSKDCLVNLHTFVSLLLHNVVAILKHFFHALFFNKEIITRRVFSSISQE
jgi:hypothetical protein